MGTRLYPGEDGDETRVRYSLNLKFGYGDEDEFFLRRWVWV